MIVDTSALIAIYQREPGFEALSRVIMSHGARVPAPVVVEYHRVATRRGSIPDPVAAEVIDHLLRNGLELEPFTPEDAEIAVGANVDYGQGNGRGGTLNLLDLMVYAIAKRMDQPIICIGQDFDLTDAKVYSAGRLA